MRELETEFSQTKGCIKGKLSIAVVSTAKYFIPGILGEFHQKYPRIDITPKVKNREEILKRVNKNHDELVIPAPPAHPLSKNKKISFHDLKNEPFMVRELGSGTRMVMELGSSSAIKQAVMAGFGLSLLFKISLE